MKGLMAYLLLLVPVFAFAQKPDNDMAKGNEEFKQKQYRDAEADYRISKSKSPAKASADYNLGNAIYRQGQKAEAFLAYSRALENAHTKQQKHMAYHNMGNVFMDAKGYQNAVEAYKNALRNNPYDEQTRYNYALAKKMLKDNPPPPPPKKDDRKDPPKDDKQDNKSNAAKNRGDSGEKADGGGSKDTPQKGGGGAGAQQSKGGADNQGNPQPASDDPSKQRMENLLDAMNNEEKKVQDRVKGVRVQAQPKKQEKDW